MRFRPPDENTDFRAKIEFTARSMSLLRAAMAALFPRKKHGFRRQRKAVSEPAPKEHSEPTCALDHGEAE